MSKAIQNKLVLIIFAVVISITSLAQAQYLETPTDKKPPLDAAIRYYDRCVTDVYTDLTPETREGFCACSSENAMKSLTAEEMQTLATGNGQPIDNKKMIREVLAPCFHFPVAEIEYKECMNKNIYRRFFKSSNAYEGMCHCLTDGITKYVQSYSQDLVSYLLERFSMTSEDPFRRMRRSVEYMNELGKYRKTCLNSYAYQ